MKGAYRYTFKISPSMLPKFPAPDGRQSNMLLAKSFTVVLQRKRHRNPRAARLPPFDPLRAAKRAHALVHAKQTHAWSKALRNADAIILNRDLQLRRRFGVEFRGIPRRVQAEFQRDLALIRARVAEDIGYALLHHTVGRQRRLLVERREIVARDEPQINLGMGERP